jgi:hypothetical protein
MKIVKAMLWLTVWLVSTLTLIWAIDPNSGKGVLTILAWCVFSFFYAAIAFGSLGIELRED